MPTAPTAHFGLVEYADGTAIQFPAGLPAFESEQCFIALQPAGYEPLVFLQSLNTSNLAFLAIAVQDIMDDYHLELSDEDITVLGGPSQTTELEVFALVAVSGEGKVSANLQAPIVVHRDRRRAVQAVQSHVAYSCQHPLGLDTTTSAQAGRTPASTGDSECS